MAELLPVQRYGAGALLALALHQAEVYREHLLLHPASLIPSGANNFPSKEVDYDEQQTNESWVHFNLGLLRPVFRHLNIDPKAWPGLEQTALSSDAKHHIGAFLRMLSEEEEQEVTATSQLRTSEASLAEAVDAIALRIEQSSMLDAPDPNHSSKKKSKMEFKAEASPEGSGLDNEIAETRLLTKQRKTTVLYELLVACVADAPEAEAKKAQLRNGYDARHRTALRLLAAWIDVNWKKVGAMEIMLAYSTKAVQEGKDANKDDPKEQKTSWKKWKRGGLIGAVAVTSGALLAITGGLAAPAIAAGLTALAPTLGSLVPIIGSSGFAAAAAAAGTAAGSAAVAASFGAAGAGLTGLKMARRTGGIDEFYFEGVGEDHEQGRLAVGIFVSGFINDPEDFTQPWKDHYYDLERYALQWESKILIPLSTAIHDWLKSSVTGQLIKQGAMMTVLSTLVTALAWPATLLALTNFIDSEWAVAVDRSDKAGKLLAEVLIKGHQGNRPVTLIGFSLGARVIFKCLETLAKNGENGRIVERVVLLGSPLTLETQRWETVRKVVAGRFVNGFSTNDWLLGVVYRASLLSQGLAGIQEVNVPGIENVDLSETVNSHSDYLSELSTILQYIDIDSYCPILL